MPAEENLNQKIQKKSWKTKIHVQFFLPFMTGWNGQKVSDFPSPQLAPKCAGHKSRLRFPDSLTGFARAQGGRSASFLAWFGSIHSLTHHFVTVQVTAVFTAGSLLSHVVGQSLQMLSKNQSHALFVTFPWPQFRVTLTNFSAWNILQCKVVRLLFSWSTS